MSEMSSETREPEAGSASAEKQPATMPDAVATAMQSAKQALAAGDSAQAHTLYCWATELDPDHAAAWAGRATTATDIDDSILSWAYVLALTPVDPEAAAALDQRIGEKIAASDRRQVESLISLGRALAEAGQKPRAYRLFEKATELDDANEDAWLWRAGVAPDLKGTMASLKEVLALNPQNAKAKAGLEWAAAQQAKAAPLPTDSEQAAKLVEQGLELLHKGNREQAHDLFKQATELDPRNEHAWLWRGSSISDVDEALACIEQALAINPENESAREARSWLRVKKLRESMTLQTDVPPPVRPAPDAVRQPRQKKGRSGNAVAFLALLVILLMILLLIILLKPPL